jgi:transcriptional repressor NrdR
MCPRCNGATRVLESRGAEDGTATRRRRECAGCGHRFTTYERRDPDPLFVRKRGGEKERFDRTKLRAALLGAAHKRPVSARDVEGVVGRIEARIAAGGGEVRSADLASYCLDELRDLDRGAYLQYAGTLPEPNAQFAGVAADSGPAGSVRLEGNHGRSTPKAAPRRGLDG